MKRQSAAYGGAQQMAPRLHAASMHNVSHELRTPLTIIQNYGVLLSSGAYGELNADQQEVLTAILKQTDTLRNLVEQIDILLAAEAGQRVLTPVDLTIIIRQVVRQRQAQARRANLRLRAELPGQPLRLLGDNRHLYYAVDCLVENAIKVTPPGGRIDVTATRGERVASLLIGDTNPARSVTAIDNDDDHFYQENNTRAHRHHRLGLRLNVARAVVQAHGGHIEATRHPDGSRRFSITLPLEKPKEMPQNDGRPGKYRSRRALNMNCERTGVLVTIKTDKVP